MEVSYKSSGILNAFEEFPFGTAGTADGTQSVLPGTAFAVKEQVLNLRIFFDPALYT